MSRSKRFREAIARFDRLNAEDPNVETADGADHPTELLYAQRMSAALERFAPVGSEVVRLAVRCQHVRRWTVPRASYPEGRDGYRRWRTDLGRFHAQTACDVLRGVGCEDRPVARVQVLLRKKRLKADPEVQLLKDMVCLFSALPPRRTPRTTAEQYVTLHRGRALGARPTRSRRS